MISLRALAKLHGNGRIRKCAIVLQGIERALYAGGAFGAARVDLLPIAAFLMEETESPVEVKSAAGHLIKILSTSADSADSFHRDTLRAINDFKHALMKASGQAPADWDLCDYLSPSNKPEPRSFYHGMRVFLEDIRSPFNVGTIIRTAEALGFEEVLLSPACADPLHPRALRSSMGAVTMIPWRRCDLDEVEALGGAIALELGGTPIGRFAFPRQAVLVLGSEELGVSSACLKIAADRRVSIPMMGTKASINVAVAFGIAAQAWISSISG